MTLRDGNFYVWHCAWCDSTNYTVWTRMAIDGLACGACHHQEVAASGESPVFMPAGMAASAGVYA